MTASMMPICRQTHLEIDILKNKHRRLVHAPRPVEIIAPFGLDARGRE
jgi:hypothetical protein